MFACVLSNVMLNTLYPESIFTEGLLRKGFKIREGREVDIMTSILVKDAMVTNVQIVSEDQSVKIIITFTRKSTGPHARRSRIPLCQFFCKIPYLISYLVENSTLKKPNLLH